MNYNHRSNPNIFATVNSNATPTCPSRYVYTHTTLGYRPMYLHLRLACLHVSPLKTAREEQPLSGTGTVLWQHRGNFILMSTVSISVHC